jgi:hypothetical protein
MAVLHVRDNLPLDMLHTHGQTQLLVGSFVSRGLQCAERRAVLLRPHRDYHDVAVWAQQLRADAPNVRAAVATTVAATAFATAADPLPTAALPVSAAHSALPADSSESTRGTVQLGGRQPVPPGGSAVLRWVARVRRGGHVCMRHDAYRVPRQLLHTRRRRLSMGRQQRRLPIRLVL